MSTADRLSDLLEVERADVYKSGVHVADLVRHVDHVEFVYLDEATEVDTVASTLRDLSAPVVTPGRSVPAFFAGLLPEGRRLTAIRRAIKTSADDDFSMLLAVGGDLVGDVQVVPAGSPRPGFGQTAGAESLEDVSFAEVFERATGREPDRVGLAGVQDKVSGRMISVPVSFGGAAHLLKLDPPEFPHLVANESFFVRLATDVGVEVVDAQVVHDRDGRAGLLVSRFDRTSGDDGLVAHAVEDGCQVLDRYPADKYAIGYGEMFAGLAVECDAPLVALRGLLRLLVLAIVTGNGDFHAKNASIVRMDGEWRLAPAYDLPSSHPYGDTTLAASLSGSRESQVSRRRFVEFGVSLGVPERAVTLTLDDLLDRIEPWVERVDELPFDDRRTVQLRRWMQTRIRLLRT